MQSTDGGTSPSPGTGTSRSRGAGPGVPPQPRARSRSPVATIAGGGLLAALLVGGAWAAHNGPITVCPAPGPGCDFTTIQDAVDGAAPGDTILVEPGSYLEDVTVPGADLSLLSTDLHGAVIDGTVTIEAAGVHVSGFEIQAPGAIAVRALGDGAEGVRLEDLLIEGAASAISVEGPGGGTRAAGAAIHGNTVRGATGAISIYLAAVEGATVAGNEVTEPAGAGTWAIMARDSTGVTIEDNLASGNAVGVLIRESSNTMVRQNTIEGGGSHGGVSLWGAAGAEVEANTIRESAVGVRVRGFPGPSADVVVEGNTFRGNPRQIDATESPDAIDLAAAFATNDFDRSVIVRGSPVKVPVLFTSIGEALEEAEAGDTVEVGPGAYDEGRLIISRNAGGAFLDDLTLRSSVPEGAEILLGSHPSLDHIQVAAHRVAIEGFRIVKQGSGGPLVLLAPDNWRPTIDAPRIEGNVLLGAGTFTGVHLGSTSGGVERTPLDVELHANRFEDTTAGVVIQHAADVTMRENNLAGAAIAIRFLSTADGVNVDARLNDWGADSCGSISERIQDDGTNNTVLFVPWLDPSGAPAAAPVRIDGTTLAFCAINEAIAASSPGDTILVEPGVYEEGRLIISRNADGAFLDGVTLRSVDPQGAEIVLGSHPVLDHIHVAAHGVAIEGFRISKQAAGGGLVLIAPDDMRSTIDAPRLEGNLFAGEGMFVGVDIGTVSLGVARIARDVEMLDNRFEQMPAAIRLGYADGVAIRGNEFIGMQVAPVQAGSVAPAPFPRSFAKAVEVRENMLEGASALVEFVWQWFDPAVELDDELTLADNTVPDDAIALRMRVRGSTTIGSATAGAPAGVVTRPTIVVAPGTYSESPTVAKPALLCSGNADALRCTGAQADTIIASPDLSIPALSITGDDVTVQRFTLRGSSPLVRVTDADRPELRANILEVPSSVSAARHGIRITGSAEAAVRDNVIGGNLAPGSVAVNVEGATGPAVSGNRVTGSRVGIRVASSTGGDLRDNLLRFALGAPGLGADTIGISLVGGSDHELGGNTYRRVRVGLALRSTTDVRVEGDTIDDADVGVALHAPSAVQPAGTEVHFVDFAGAITPLLLDGSPMEVSGVHVDARRNHWGRYSREAVAGAVDNRGTGNTIDVSCFLASDRVTEICPPAPVVTDPGEGQAFAHQDVNVEGMSAEAGATVILRDGDGDVAAETSADGTGRWAALLEGLDEGSHSVTAQGTLITPDGVMTRSAQSPPRSFFVDLTPPTISLDPVAAFIGDATPTLSGTADVAGAAQVTVKVYAGVAASGTPARTLTGFRDGATGAWSAQVSPPLDEGTYTGQAEQSDAAGNLGVSETRTFTVDLTAPTVTIEAPAHGSVVGVAEPLIRGRAGVAPGDSDTVAVEVFESEEATGAPAQTLSTTRHPGNGEWEVGVADPLSDGAYTVRMTQSDEAGNVGVSDPVTFGVDLTPPQIDVTFPQAVTYRQVDWLAGCGTESGDVCAEAFDPEAGGIASGVAEVRISLLRDETGLWWDGAAFTSAAEIHHPAALAAGAWRLAVPFESFPADGSYTLGVVALDGVGNEATATVGFDIERPLADPVITSPAEGQHLNDTLVVIAGTAEPEALVTVLHDGDAVGSDTAAPNGAWEVAAGFPEGAHTIQVFAERDGRVSEAVDRSFIVDVTPPDPPVITTPSSGAVLRNPVRVEGIGDAGALVRLYADGSQVAAVVAQAPGGPPGGDQLGEWSATISPADGSRVLTADAIDEAGNVSGVSNTVTITVDSVRPTVSITTASGTTFMPSSGSPAIHGTASDNDRVSRVELTYTNLITGVVATFIAPCQPPGWCEDWTHRPVLGPGRYQVQAVAVDRAGNRSPAAAITFTHLAIF